MKRVTLFLFCAALLLCSCVRESEPDSNVKAVVKLSVSDILSSSATITVESRQKDVTGYLLLPPQKYDDVAPYLSMDAIEKLAIIKDKAQKQESLTPLRVQGLKPRNKYFVGVVGIDSGGEVITAPVFTTFETVTLNTALSTVYEGRTPEGKYAFKAKLSPDPSTVKFKYVFDGKYIASTAAELRELLLSSSPDVKTATEAVELRIESETKKVMLAALPFDLDENEGQLSSLLSAGDMTLVTVDIDGVQTLESTEEDDNVYEGMVNVPSTAEFTVTISGEQYGFLSWSGVGGVGSFTEKYNIAYPPVGLNAAQNDTRPLSYSVSKSIGRMAKISDGGNKFWISLGGPAKLFVRIDLGNADGIPRYYFRLPDEENVILYESFDLFAYSGDYMKPANGCAVPLALDKVDGTEPGTMQAWNLTNAQGANKNEVGYEKTWFDYPEQLHGKVLAPQTYIRNRDLSGWKILNGGERVGALQLSVSGKNTFGRLETPELSSLTESTNLKLELDLARFSGASKNRIAVRVEGGGSFSRGEVTVDGKSKKTLTVSGNEFLVGYEGDVCPPTVSNGTVDKPVSHFVFDISGAVSTTKIVIDTSVDANEKGDNANASRCFVFELKLSKL